MNGINGNKAGAIWPRFPTTLPNCPRQTKHELENSHSHTAHRKGREWSIRNSNPRGVAVAPGLPIWSYLHPVMIIIITPDPGCVSSHPCLSLPTPILLAFCLHPGRVADFCVSSWSSDLILPAACLPASYLLTAILWPAGRQAAAMQHLAHTFFCALLLFSTIARKRFGGYTCVRGRRWSAAWSVPCGVTAAIVRPSPASKQPAL